MATPRIVFLGSAGGGVMAQLLRHAFVREMAEAAVADRDCPFLAVATHAGVAATCLPSASGLAFSDALLAHFGPSSERVFICYYSRLLGGAFLQAHAGRIVNSHPSLLPACPGMRGFEDTLASNAMHMGSTLHLIDAGVDSGPTLIQAALPLDRSRPAAENRHKVFLTQVHSALQFLRWLREGRIACGPNGRLDAGDNGRVRINGARLAPSIFAPNLDDDHFDFFGEPNPFA